jgi:hypothetical protein
MAPSSSTHAPHSSGDRSRLRGLGCWLVVALGWIALFEGASWMFFHAVKADFIFYDLADFTVTPENIRKQDTWFDAELGWRERFATRFGERPSRLAEGAPVMAVFGDSFIYGGEVSDEETVAEHLAKAFGRPVLNFGGGGYGMDQALLRFERSLAGTRAPVALFEFISENINRNLNVYRKFYNPKTGIPMTKPRFVVENGQLRLVANPIRTAEERNRLSDTAALRDIGRLDAWYNRQDLPVLGFPYSGIFFTGSFWRQLGLILAHRPPGDLNAAPWVDMWQNPQAVELSFLILDRFHAGARRQGAIPLIVPFPQRGEVDDYKRSHAVPLSIVKTRAECEKRGWSCLFPLLEAETIFSGDTGTYFAPHGHFSALGERAMARWLFDKIDGRFVSR